MISSSCSAYVAHMRQRSSCCCWMTLPSSARHFKTLRPTEFSTGFPTRPSCRPICSIGGPGHRSQDRSNMVKCWQIMARLPRGIFQCPRLWISGLRVDLGTGFSLMFASPRLSRWPKLEVGTPLLAYLHQHFSFPLSKLGRNRLMGLHP